MCAGLCFASQRSLRLAPLAALALLAAAPGTAQSPLGGEFGVTVGASALSFDSAVRMRGDGSFVVVWQQFGSSGNDNSGSSIQARRFDGSGAALGDPVQVNSFTTGVQSEPQIALDATGGYLVVWSSQGSPESDSSDLSVQAQLFESDGDPVGSQFQLNSLTTGQQTRPQAAFLPSGEFLAAWSSAVTAGDDTASVSIQIRRFSAAGVPVGAEFQVNSHTTGNQFSPDIGVDGAGAFVVAWDSASAIDSVPPGDALSVIGRRFNAAGTALAPDFQLNTYNTGGQFGAGIGMRADGSFVVGWTSAGSFGNDSSSYSIQAREYSSAGAPVASEFQVNTFTTGTQTVATLSRASDGGYVVAWQSAGSPGNDNQQISVQARQFHAGGEPAGDQLQVNTTTVGEQRQPRVAANAAGDFVVVWEDDPPGSFGSGPVAQRGQRLRGVLFADGFESGNRDRWSTTTPP